MPYLGLVLLSLLAILIVPALLFAWWFDITWITALLTEVGVASAIALLLSIFGIAKKGM